MPPDIIFWPPFLLVAPTAAPPADDLKLTVDYLKQQQEEAINTLREAIDNNNLVDVNKVIENENSLHCYSNWCLNAFTGEVADFVGAIDGDHGDYFVKESNII